MQIEFGERKVWIAGAQVTAHFLVAVLSYSRRIFVKRNAIADRGSGWGRRCASP